MLSRAVVVLCVCACALSSCPEVTAEVKGGEKPTLKAVAHSNLNFTSALYAELAGSAEGSENLFVSPLSVHTILTLATMGARGSTADQMRTGLALPEDDDVTLDGYHKLTTSLKRNDEHTVLKIANKIFADAHFDLKPGFAQVAQHNFNADAVTADFRRNPEAARADINKWVEENTQHKIRDMLPEGSLTHDTEMVLMNAVYFKSQWATPFNASLTTTEPFYVTEGETKDVQMMHLRGEFFYKKSKEIDAQILELPYIDNKMSMLVILPNKRNNLAEVEQKLKEVPLTTITKHLRLPEVIVSLPKFKMEHSIELTNVLKKMGMTNMFSRSANFSGITDSPVFVDKVAHKAFIEVNEEGSEAAGASGVLFQARMGGRSWEPFVFKADHPFIFMIRHKYKNNPVLFMGRFALP